VAETELVAAGCQGIVANGVRRGQPCNAATVPNYPFCHHHMQQIARPRGRANNRYGRNLPDTLRQDFENMLEDSDPKNLVPEIANLRTLVGKLLEQTSALDEDGNLTISKKELEYVYAGMKLIGELTERQNKINPDKFVPVSEVMRIITDIVDIVRTNLPPDMMPIRERIAGEIQRYCMGQVLNRPEDSRRGPNQS
jgi:hypothetical protein